MRHIWDILGETHGSKGFQPSSVIGLHEFQPRMSKSFITNYLPLFFDFLTFVTEKLNNC